MSIPAATLSSGSSSSGQPCWILSCTGGHGDAPEVASWLQSTTVLKSKHGMVRFMLILASPLAVLALSRPRRDIAHPPPAIAAAVPSDCAHAASTDVLDTVPSPPSSRSGSDCRAVSILSVERSGTSPTASLAGDTRE